MYCVWEDINLFFFFDIGNYEMIVVRIVLNNFVDKKFEIV